MNLAPIILRKPFLDFRIAFLETFWKDEAQGRPKYEEICAQSEAGVFEVRIVMV